MASHNFVDSRYVDYCWDGIFSAFGWPSVIRIPQYHRSHLFSKVGDHWYIAESLKGLFFCIHTQVTIEPSEWNGLFISEVEYIHPLQSTTH